MRTIQIVIATQGNPRVETVEAAYRLSQSDFTPHFEKGWHSAADTKSHAVVWFLKKSKADFYLQLDDDVIPPDNFLSLAERDVEIVSGLYPLYNPQLGIMPFESVFFRANGGDYSPWNPAPNITGMVECDAIGGGALCIAREVLEKVKPAFLDHFDEWGRKSKSEDIHFSEEAKKLGYKIWADCDVRCDHIKQFAVRNMCQRIIIESTMWHAMNKEII